MGNEISTKDADEPLESSVEEMNDSKVDEDPEPANNLEEWYSDEMMNCSGNGIISEDDDYDGSLQANSHWDADVNSVEPETETEAMEGQVDAARDESQPKEITNEGDDEKGTIETQNEVECMDISIGDEAGDPVPDKQLQSADNLIKQTNSDLQDPLKILGGDKDVLDCSNGDVVPSTTTDEDLVKENLKNGDVESTADEETSGPVPMDQIPSKELQEPENTQQDVEPTRDTSDVFDNPRGNSNVPGDKPESLLKNPNKRILADETEFEALEACQNDPLELSSLQRKRPRVSMDEELGKSVGVSDDFEHQSCETSTVSSASSPASQRREESENSGNEESPDNSISPGQTSSADVLQREIKNDSNEEEMEVQVTDETGKSVSADQMLSNEHILQQAEIPGPSNEVEKSLEDSNQSQNQVLIDTTNGTSLPSKIPRQKRRKLKPLGRRGRFQVMFKKKWRRYKNDEKRRHLPPRRRLKIRRAHKVIRILALQKRKNLMKSQLAKNSVESVSSVQTSSARIPKQDVEHNSYQEEMEVEVTAEASRSVSTEQTPSNGHILQQAKILAPKHDLENTRGDSEKNKNSLLLVPAVPTSVPRKPPCQETVSIKSIEVQPGKTNQPATSENSPPEKKLSRHQRLKQAKEEKELRRRQEFDDLQFEFHPKDFTVEPPVMLKELRFPKVVYLSGVPGVAFPTRSTRPTGTAEPTKSTKPPESNKPEAEEKRGRTTKILRRLREEHFKSEQIPENETEEGRIARLNRLTTSWALKKELWKADRNKRERTKKILRRLREEHFKSEEIPENETKVERLARLNRLTTSWALKREFWKRKDFIEKGRDPAKALESRMERYRKRRQEKLEKWRLKNMKMPKRYKPMFRLLLYCANEGLEAEDNLWMTYDRWDELLKLSEIVKRRLCQIEPNINGQPENERADGNAGKAVIPEAKVSVEAGKNEIPVNEPCYDKVRVLPKIAGMAKSSEIFAVQSKVPPKLPRESGQSEELSSKPFGKINSSPKKLPYERYKALLNIAEMAKRKRMAKAQNGVSSSIPAKSAAVSIVPSPSGKLASKQFEKINSSLKKLPESRWNALVDIAENVERKRMGKAQSKVSPSIPEESATMPVVPSPPTQETQSRDSSVVKDQERLARPLDSEELVKLSEPKIDEKSENEKTDDKVTGAVVSETEVSVEAEKNDSLIEDSNNDLECIEMVEGEEISVTPREVPPHKPEESTATSVLPSPSTQETQSRDPSVVKGQERLARPLNSEELMKSSKPQINEKSENNRTDEKFAEAVVSETEVLIEVEENDSPMKDPPEKDLECLSEFAETSSIPEKSTTPSAVPSPSTQEVHSPGSSIIEVEQELPRSSHLTIEVKSDDEEEEDEIQIISKVPGLVKVEKDEVQALTESSAPSKLTLSRPPPSIPQSSPVAKVEGIPRKKRVRNDERPASSQIDPHVKKDRISPEESRSKREKNVQTVDKARTINEMPRGHVKKSLPSQIRKTSTGKKQRTKRILSEKEDEQMNKWEKESYEEKRLGWIEEMERLAMSRGAIEALPGPSSTSTSHIPAPNVQITDEHHRPLADNRGGSFSSGYGTQSSLVAPDPQELKDSTDKHEAEEWDKRRAEEEAMNNALLEPLVVLSELDGIPNSVGLPRKPEKSSETMKVTGKKKSSSLEPKKRKRSPSPEVEVVMTKNPLVNPFAKLGMKKRLKINQEFSDIDEPSERLADVEQSQKPTETFDELEELSAASNKKQNKLMDNGDEQNTSVRTSTTPTMHSPNLARVWYKREEKSKKACTKKLFTKETEVDRKPKIVHVANDDEVDVITLE